MKAIILHKSGIFSILFIFNMFVCKGQIEYNTLRAEIIANSTVGAGDTLFATAVGGTTWQWTGPNNFTSSNSEIATALFFDQLGHLVRSEEFSLSLQNHEFNLQNLKPGYCSLKILKANSCSILKVIKL